MYNNICNNPLERLLQERYSYTEQINSVSLHGQQNLYTFIKWELKSGSSHNAVKCLQFIINKFHLTFLSLLFPQPNSGQTSSVFYQSQDILLFHFQEQRSYRQPTTYRILHEVSKKHILKAFFIIDLLQPRREEWEKVLEKQVSFQIEVDTRVSTNHTSGTQLQEHAYSDTTPALSRPSTTASITMLQIIATIWASNSSMLVYTFNFSRAFDTVYHATKLNSLQIDART